MDSKVIHSVFETCVTQNSSATAIETADATITYDELNKQSNKLAHLLRAIGKGKDDIIATLFENELLHIHAILGVFKSGSIYLPLDKKYKYNHWAQLYTKLQPKVLLTSHDNWDLLDHYNKVFKHVIPEVIILNLVEHELIFKYYVFSNGLYKEINKCDSLSTSNPELLSNGEDSNYIFFTSGSTGIPKAVLGQHKSLSHFIHWETKELDINEKDRIGQFTSFSFDASLRDVFVPLIKGGTICVPPKSVKDDLQQLTTWIGEAHVTILHTIPTLFRLLTNNERQFNGESTYPSLRYILLAGEKLYNRDITGWRNAYGSNTTIINLYGATESTLVKTFYRVGEQVVGNASDALCVGQPIANTMVLILNNNNQLCRLGEVGSIYIKTPFLSKGYYGDQLQTAEKFIQNPLSKDYDIIYKTGDYGKYDVHRNTIVLGREDGMVKLNGVRVDVNSIESTLLELEDVQIVKCMVYQLDTANATIVCFYKSVSLKEEDIRRYCEKRLSQYEVPSIIFRLGEFPINANGKIDSPALKSSIPGRMQGKQHKGQVLSPLEQEIAELWQEVLGISQPNSQKSFLSLGGNSIKQILLRSKIRAKFKVNLSIEELYLHDTVQKQAEQVSFISLSQDDIKDDKILPAPSQAEGYTLSNEQMRVWVTSQSEAESVAHNMAYSYLIQGALNLNVFKKALHDIVQRHEALRTNFTVTSRGDLVQVISNETKVDSIINYVSKENKLDTCQLQEVLNTFNSHVFDLTTAPLFRILLIQLTDNEFRMATLMHHIIGDYTSDQVILTELMHLYASYENNTPPDLKEITVQYKDYAHWIKNKLLHNEFPKDKLFWTQHLEGILQHSKWYKAVEHIDYTGAYYQQDLSNKLVQQLINYCADTKYSFFGIFATALGILIHKISGQKDILVGAPMNLRNHPDLLGLVGLYLNLSPFRLQVHPQGSVAQLIEQTTKSHLQAMEHLFYPFDTIIDDFEQHNSFNLLDRIDVYLNLINRDDANDSTLTTMRVTPQERQLNSSKFPLCFYVSNHGSRISLNIEYQTAIFDRVEISRLADRFCLCLEQLVSGSDKKIDSVSLVDKKKIPSFNLR